MNNQLTQKWMILLLDDEKIKRLPETKHIDKHMKLVLKMQALYVTIMQINKWYVDFLF